MLFIDGRKKINPAILKSTAYITTGRYFIRLFVTNRDDGTLVTDQYGVKLGEFKDLVHSEMWIRDFEKRTGVEARRYLHCMS